MRKHVQSSSCENPSNRRTRFHQVGLVAIIAALASLAAPASTALAAPGWQSISRMNLVFSEYGGPTTIGTTADEDIYVYCQKTGTWNWQLYVWVPSLNSNGWIRVEDLTGYTNPIPDLGLCE